MKHTPTPWAIDGFNITGIIAKESKGNYFRICECSHEGQEFDESKANAEFIVRACNVYEDMFKALQRIREYMLQADRDGQYYFQIPMNCETTQMIESALTKAEEEAVRHAE